MASDTEPDDRRPNGVTPDDEALSPIEPATPRETGPPPSSSQITLPSTEVPGSPIDPNQSFKTEVNDDRPGATVIPSSLTPPPSTQVAAHAASNARRTYSQSQPSVLFSPPATILNNIRERDLGSDFVPPASQQILEGSVDELRAMLQTCVAEHHKLKMEAAHHKLQFNLLSLQAEEDSKRAAVEHDMVRREVDALRLAEHSRQAKRELSTASESTQLKYLQMKKWYEEAMEENETLHRRVKAAKKVIQQKEEETIGLAEERDMLLTRIRENREHFHRLCSPGGIFHHALTPKQQVASTPQQYRPAAHHHTPRSAQRGEHDTSEHGLSALLQAMSQDNNNNSAPSTPHRAIQRHAGKHNRNAQSMSSLPTTPVNRTRDAALLPSVDLVPQTEPRYRHTQSHFARITSTPKHERRRKSRESTISVEDTEELARQAMESAAAASSVPHASQEQHARHRRRAENDDGQDVFDSQASQAATEMLRRNPGRSFDVASSAGSRDGSPHPTETSARMQAKLLSGSTGGAGDKRKFSGGMPLDEDLRRGHGSPPKKLRVGGLLTEDPRVGLGIQYRE
ncbi:FAD-dependent oxidoreductase-like enzyme [Purpureocillium lavendulum]|uniref:FAD-dependent oxidoreductase-like enzyme n=1 Tax=Purpureocillium lavendulum TaxID=1247861 RepID=A0AB34FLX5_9HYPO|nr:FAD-dependent oxidoreductase-like enzyme [Purpureocillium lavendulum]